MKKRCPNCRLVNYPHSPECIRCRFDLIEVSTLQAEGANKPSVKYVIVRRAVVCAAVCVTVLIGFYLSLIFTSASLKYEEKEQIKRAVKILDEKGFRRRSFSSELFNELSRQR
jgi:hypothetical protein